MQNFSPATSNFGQKDHFHDKNANVSIFEIFDTFSKLCIVLYICAKFYAILIIFTDFRVGVILPPTV